LVAPTTDESNATNALNMPEHLKAFSFEEAAAVVEVLVCVCVVYVNSSRKSSKSG